MGSVPTEIARGFGAPPKSHRRVPTEIARGFGAPPKPSPMAHGKPLGQCKQRGCRYPAHKKVGYAGYCCWWCKNYAMYLRQYNNNIRQNPPLAGFYNKNREWCRGAPKQHCNVGQMANRCTSQCSQNSRPISNLSGQNLPGQFGQRRPRMITEKDFWNNQLAQDTQARRSGRVKTPDYWKRVTLEAKRRYNRVTPENVFVSGQGYPFWNWVNRPLHVRFRSSKSIAVETDEFSEAPPPGSRRSNSIVVEEPDEFSQAPPRSRSRRSSSRGRPASPRAQTPGVHPRR